VNAGRFIAVLLVLSGLLAGVGMWYAQTRAYYTTVELDSLPAVLADGTPITLRLEAPRAIDSDSSPLRFRACVSIGPDLAARLGEQGAPAPDAEPLIAPDWFDCFDARAIAADLAAGRARAILLEANFRFGFDRVMALHPDGRGYVWHQTNACGTAHFDGRPLPPGCPPPPQR
jgi:hypothetical protein